MRDETADEKTLIGDYRRALERGFYRRPRRPSEAVPGGGSPSTQLKRELHRLVALYLKAYDETALAYHQFWMGTAWQALRQIRGGEGIWEARLSLPMPEPWQSFPQELGGRSEGARRYTGPDAYASFMEGLRLIDALHDEGLTIDADEDCPGSEGTPGSAPLDTVPPWGLSTEQLDTIVNWYDQNPEEYETYWWEACAFLIALEYLNAALEEVVAFTDELAQPPDTPDLEDHPAWMKLRAAATLTRFIEPRRYHRR